jgi:hypothetical protein
MPDDKTRETTTPATDKPATPNPLLTPTPVEQPPTTETVYTYDPNDPNRPPETVTPLDDVPDEVRETGQPRTPDPPSVPRRSSKQD